MNAHTSDDGCSPVDGIPVIRASLFIEHEDLREEAQGVV